MRNIFTQRRWTAILLVATMGAMLFLSACGMIQPRETQTEKRAKNVILFIGDGCGFNHEDAASLYLTGRKDALPHQNLEVQLAMSTYMVNGSYNPESIWANFENIKGGSTDSAAAGTAMATGTKTYRGAIGMGPNKENLVSLVERAEALGKSTGVVSSVQLSHATPATFCAHNESRNNYEQIANEMLAESALDLLIGCGHPLYSNSGVQKDKGNYKYVGGEQTWKQLVDGKLGADADGDGRDDHWAFYEDTEELMQMPDALWPKRIALVPRVQSTLQQGREGDRKAGAFQVEFTEGIPRLPELTTVALKSLERDPDGFFLMIEGGAIDWASHGNQSGRMIEETADFAAAIQAALNWIENNGGFEQNLLIVTADHETGYLTGPASGTGDPKQLWTEIGESDKGEMPAMKWNSGGHTNCLAPFYAQGPGAENYKALVRGQDPEFGPYIDNTDIVPVILNQWGIAAEK